MALLILTTLSRLALADAPIPPYPGGKPLAPEDGNSLASWFIVVLATTSVAFAVARLKTLRNKKPIRRRPPLNAEFLLYLFMAPQHCNALVGDLEERYNTIRKKFGARRANLWFWAQAIRSVGPIVCAWFRKVLMKPIIAVLSWAAANRIVDHNSWLAGILDIWRRIRS